VVHFVESDERKKGQNPKNQEMDVLKNPKKVAEFCLEKGIGFIPYGGYGISAVELIRKEEQDESSAKAVAAKVLANGPDPQSREALVRAVSNKSWVAREAALEAIAKRADPHPFWAISRLRCPTKTTMYGTPQLRSSSG
jgi:hypothetical protein